MYDNSDASSCSVLRMAYEFQACAVRIRTLPWKIFSTTYAWNTHVRFSRLTARGSALLSRISDILQTITRN